MQIYIIFSVPCYAMYYFFKKSGIFSTFINFLRLFTRYWSYPEEQQGTEAALLQTDSVRAFR